jgi:predicted DNA-binding transcriptional regulator YafY
MPNKPGVSHQERMLRVEQALLDGEVLDRYSAAKRFAVNHAAAYDLLNRLVKLKQQLFERVEDRPVKFKRRIPLTDEPCAIAPALAATLAAGFSRSFHGTLIERELLGIRDRTIAKLSEKKQRKFEHIDRKVVVRTPEEADVSSRERILLDVIDGVLDQKEMEIEYQTFEAQREKRKIHPYSLVALSSRLYVVAPKDGKVHPFRLDRIVRTRFTGAPFLYPTMSEYDPERVFEKSWGIWINGPAPERVIVRLDAPWGGYAKHHKWHPSQKTKVLADGGAELTFTISPCREFESWVLGFGAEAEVLSPESVRKQIAARLQSGALKYRD